MGIANFRRDRKKTISIVASLSLGGVILLVTASILLVRSPERIARQFFPDGNEYGQVQGLPARFVSDKELCKLALSVAHDGNVYGGMICSGDKFITDKEELTEIKKRFPEGMAVDMESCAIAQVCYMCGVPFLSYRIISDTPGVKDHYKQYLNFWEEAPKRSFEMIKVLIKALSEE